MIKELVCIKCPMGCHLTVDVDKNEVKGNTCRRGKSYGLSEVTNPVRVITTTIRVVNGQMPVLPVKTEEAIPKALNMKAMDILNNIEVKAPIKIGDIIVENILETGVNVIATRNVKTL